MNESLPSVSVVLATRNRSRLLARALDGLSRQRWPHARLEIIIADNGSTDSTRSVVEAFAKRHDISTTYLYVETPGKSQAVNAALGRAQGVILAFTDDDVIPEPDWIEQLAGAVLAGADFVAGRILPRWEAAPPPWISASVYGVLAIPDNGAERRAITTGSDPMPIGANMAIRSDVARRIGGLRTDLGKLDGTLQTGEDHEFFLRMIHAGFAGVYEPRAVVRHWVPRERMTRSYFRRWLHQNGRDVARLERLYPAPVARLFGVPQYLVRQALLDCCAAVAAAMKGDNRRRFASTSRVVWFLGYVREALPRRAGAAS